LSIWLNQNRQLNTDMNTMTYVNLLATAIVFAMFIYHILVGINVNMNC